MNLDQNLLLLIIVVVLLSSYSKEILKHLPTITLILLTTWVGYNIITQDKYISQHTCGKLVLTNPEYIEGDRSEGMETKNTIKTPQYDDLRPDYKNIKVHTEKNMSKSYPVSNYDYEDKREITNYPFELLEDSNSDVRAYFAQNDTDGLVQGEKDPDIYGMFYNKRYNGDEAIANRMSYTSSMPKRSIVNRAKLDKYTLAPFLEEELEQHANSRWWDNDALEHIF